MLRQQPHLKDTEQFFASSSKLIHGMPHDDDTTTSSFTTTPHSGKRIEFWDIFKYILLQYIGTHKEKHIISDLPSIKTLSISEKLPHQQHSTLSSSTTKHSSTISDHKSTTGGSGVSPHELGEGGDIMWYDPLCGSPLELKQKEQEHIK